MTFAPTRPIPAPLRRQNLVGALTSTVNVITGERMAPFAFTPELCGCGGSAAPCGTDTKDLTDTPAEQTWTPYWIHQGTSCERSSGPESFTDAQARASRALTVNTSSLIEQTLWTGLVDGSAFPDTPNHKLADTGAFQPNGRTAVGLTTGIWDIVEYLNDTLCGAAGVIHVEQRVVPFLDFYGLVSRDGNRLFLANTNHYIVAGTGYPGTDPDGAAPAAGESWIYGTSDVEVRHDQISLLPDLESEGLDRTNNTIEVRAERLAVAYWDDCAHVGTAVCLEEPGPACETGS